MNLSRPTKIATPISRTRTRTNTNNNNDVVTANDDDDDDDDDNLLDKKIDTIIFNPLSFKLSQLSTEERSSGLHDLHGVSEKINNETPEMLHMKQIEMTIALNSIASWGAEDSLAFRTALEKSPEYVDSLKIRFLRADLYDIHAAAERMVRFFDEKMNLFGEEKLVKEITFDDLSKEEVEALERGSLQLLPLRDRANRAIMLQRGDLNTEYLNHDTVMRAFFYIMMATHTDEEIQKNGTIAISWSINQKYLVPGRFGLYWKLWSSLPARQSGFHYCQNSMDVNKLALLLFSKYAERKQVGRFRVHFGSHLECIYELMTFGIPREAISIQDDGTFDLTHHHQMLETLKYRERNHHHHHDDRCQHSDLEHSSTIPSQPAGHSYSLESSSLDRAQQQNDDSESIISVSTTSSAKIILVPGQMDILLGRGRQQEKRPGMVRMNSLLDEYWDSYEAASKFDKTVIAGIILNSLKESNCRFLGVVPDGYVECDDLTARKRIAHSFRSLRKKKKTAGVGKTCCNSTTNESVTENNKENGGKIRKQSEKQDDLPEVKLRR